MTDGEVRDLYARLLDAWNRRDADAFAALFGDDGAMIGFDGSQAAGPAIRDHLGPVFAGHPTAAYVARVREVRSLAPGVALLRAAAGMVPPGGDDLNPDVNTLQTLLAHRAVPEHAGTVPRPARSYRAAPGRAAAATARRYDGRLSPSPARRAAVWDTTVP